MTIQSWKRGRGCFFFWFIGCPYVLNLQTDFSERKECIGRHHRHGDALPPQLAPQLARQREDEDPDDARDGDVVT
jgi:hypothetical protein